MVRKDEWEFGETGGRPSELFVGLTRNGFSFGRQVCEEFKLNRQEKWFVFYLKKDNQAGHEVAFLFTKEPKSIQHNPQKTAPVQLYFARDNFASAGAGTFLNKTLKMKQNDLLGRYSAKTIKDQNYGKLLVITINGQTE